MDELKLYLVEDEKPILKGLIQTYDWSGMGYQVIGSALSGEMAIQDIRKLHPDVVLTDIRMRGMDGLELIERVQKVLPDTLFIVISAYKDFEYAQKACQIGAFSYLLKPLTDEGLRTVMQSARETYLQRKRFVQEHDAWKQILVENSLKFQETMLERYLDECISEQEIYSIFTGMGERIHTGSRFVVLCADIDLKYKIVDPIQYEIRRFTFNKHLSSALDTTRFWNLYMPDKQIFIISQDEMQRRHIKHILTLVQRELEFDVIFAVSPVGTGLEGLRCSYQQVLRLFDIAREAGAGLFDWEMITGGEDVKNYSEYSEQHILNTLRRNDRDSLVEACKQYFAQLPSGRDDTYLKICIQHLAVNAELLLGNTYGMTREMQDRFALLYKSMESISAMKLMDLLHQVLLEAMELRGQLQPLNTDIHFDAYIQKAQAYIEQNIHDPELNIAQVAEVVYLNAAYFGRLFKSKVGVSFRKYLVRHRIQMAKDLLLNDAYEIQEISERVGILNPSYFSQVFKQEVGYLPSEYKQELEVKGNEKTAL